MCAAVKSCAEESEMGFESIVSLGAAVLLLVYLAYALLRPEKF